MKAGTEGWYGPEGQFVWCDYGQHENTAIWLCDTVRVADWPSDCPYARDALTRAGWVYVGTYCDEDVAFGKAPNTLRLIEHLAPALSENTVLEFGDQWMKTGDLYHVRFSPSAWRESGESFLEYVRSLVLRSGRLTECQ
jgi:hypothetical protein